MGEKKTAVFGIYSSREAAERAADALVNAGFTPADLSVLLPENLGNRAIGTEKATKAPEGATAGGGTGAVEGKGESRQSPRPRWPSLLCRGSNTPKASPEVRVDAPTRR